MSYNTVGFHGVHMKVLLSLLDKAFSDRHYQYVSPTYGVVYLDGILKDIYTRQNKLGGYGIGGYGNGNSRFRKYCTICDRRIKSSRKKHTIQKLLFCSQKCLDYYKIRLDTICGMLSLSNLRLK